METLHPRLESFGPKISPDALVNREAVELVAYLGRGLDTDVRLVECRLPDGPGSAAILVELRPERPQVRAADIRRWEPILVVFREIGSQPRVLAARADFPYTAHQYFVPPGGMRSLCVDERPWDEARATWTPFTFLDRVRRWLGSAAAGELTGEGQAIEPYFLGTLSGIVLPNAVFCDVQPPAFIHAWLPNTPNPRLILTKIAGGPSVGRDEFRVLTVTVQAQMAGPMRHAPANLLDLSTELEGCSIDLLATIRSELVAALASPDLLEARLILLVIVPIQRSVLAPPELFDLKAFVTHMSLGEVGCRLGCLDTAAEGGRGFVRAIGLPRSTEPDKVPLDMLQVHRAFDRDLAAICSGVDRADQRNVALIGAGAMGSHIAMTLVREGCFTWTAIDPDILHPHNLARHTLLPADLGRPKAVALAEALNAIGGPTTARALISDFQHPIIASQSSDLESTLGSVDLVLDASASVAVARALADRISNGKRAASAFLNPQGTASVLLMEDAGRTCRLDVLEAQYYRAVLREPTLADHLSAPAAGFKYAGACRSVTNRIPEANVAILGGVVARALPSALVSDTATITVWSLNPSGSINLHPVRPARIRQTTLGEWRIVVDEDIVGLMTRLRDECLPDETGGVLVGVVDTARRVIILVDVIHAPTGSIGSERDFERGAVDLPETLDAIATRTGGQARYVGEWHSHPRDQPAAPSHTDCRQLAYLRSEMGREGLPALMMIAGSGEVGVFGLTDSDDHAEAPTQS